MIHPPMLSETPLRSPMSDAQDSSEEQPRKSPSQPDEASEHIHRPGMGIPTWRSHDELQARRLRRAALRQQLGRR